VVNLYQQEMASKIRFTEKREAFFFFFKLKALSQNSVGHPVVYIDNILVHIEPYK